VLAVLGLLLSRASYVPIWDGFVYAEAINEAAKSPTIGSLRLAGHASQAYAALAIAVQALAINSRWPLFVLSIALLYTAVLGFYRLASITYPGPAHRLDRALLTAIFLAQPTLLAAVMQPGIDLPLVPAFVWSIVWVLEGRRVAAILVATALAFTKETGVLLYTALVASYGVWSLLRGDATLRGYVRTVVRVAPLAIPLVVFVAYLFYRKYTRPVGEEVVWTYAALRNESLLRQLIVPRIDRFLLSNVANVLVLNFAWIATAVIAGGTVVTARSIGSARSLHARWQATLDKLATVPGLLVMLTIVSGYLLTRVATFTNSRYLLGVMPLFVIVLYTALLALRVPGRGRQAMLGSYAVLLIVSAVRTVDPVSRWVYGTFDFGDRQMLRMTSITGECCAAGRDQLVYNLEFTELESLMNTAMTTLVPRDSTLIMVPDSTDWYLVPRLDVRTNRRTTARDNARSLIVVETRPDSVHAYARQWRHAYYLALPNGAAARGLRDLASAFAIGPEHRFRRGGYWLSVYSLTPLIDGEPARRSDTSRSSGAGERGRQGRHYAVLSIASHVGRSPLALAARTSHGHRHDGQATVDRGEIAATRARSAQPPWFTALCTCTR